MHFLITGPGMPQVLSTSENETEITLDSSQPIQRGLREFHCGKRMISLHLSCSDELLGGIQRLQCQRLLGEVLEGLG